MAQRKCLVHGHWEGHEMVQEDRTHQTRVGKGPTNKSYPQHTCRMVTHPSIRGSLWCEGQPDLV